MNYKIALLTKGTYISINLRELQQFLDNDEAYFVWCMPHKSLDEIFKTRVNVGNVLSRLRDHITTPVISEKCGYSIRINEARLLPEEITRIGAFHHQKLKIVGRLDTNIAPVFDKTIIEDIKEFFLRFFLINDKLEIIDN